MTVSAATKPVPLAEIAPKTKDTKGNKYITWASFQNRYLGKEDGYTYEWNNGAVEKSPISMDISQFFIWRNLYNFFMQLMASQKIGGYLVTEVDILLNEERHRRPDIAYLTDAQLDNALINQIQIPAFVVEIISPNDKAEKVRQKVLDYLSAGVQVVWNVYPEAKAVDIYEISGKAFTCSGAQLCSAEAVIPGFLIAVDDLLKKPD